MAEPEESDVVRSLATAAPGEESFDLTLQQVVDLACASVAGCSMAGITLLERSGPTTTVATSAVAASVDAFQYRVNAGPCLDAYRRQITNRIDSTDSEERWPEFCREAAANGVHAVLSYPLVVGGDGIGALNLYSATEHGFDDRAARSGAVFASHAAVTLANARAFWRTDELRRHLEDALQSRGVIDQAKGILIAQEGYSPERAFEVLKRASQRSNRKVHDLALEIVESAQHLATERPASDR
ncbi:MAG TPA: GAF and ANTAR domain-containing protein [Acidimicrobiales bacterium]|nr:GAF and ANTAR domain-containing protein [Acidimicrobiales bacterium]